MDRVPFETAKLLFQMYGDGFCRGCYEPLSLAQYNSLSPQGWVIVNSVVCCLSCAGAYDDGREEPAHA